VSDLTRSPWLRAALLVLAAGLAVYGLASQWTQVQSALAKLDGWDVAGAAVSAIAGLGAMMLAWRALLADLGSRLPLPAAIRVMFVGQLGKYVPGAVWAVAAQVELARDYAVPRRRSGTASLVSMAVTLLVGLVAAGVTLPLVSAHAVRQYWWVLAVTPLAAACLYPPVIKFGLDRVLRVLGRAPLEGSVSRGGMVRALGWTTLGWLCYGASAWFLISVFAGKGPGSYALSLGAYALAWAVGFQRAEQVLLVARCAGQPVHAVAHLVGQRPGRGGDHRHAVRERQQGVLRGGRLPVRHDQRVRRAEQVRDLVRGHVARPHRDPVGQA